MKPVFLLAIILMSFPALMWADGKKKSGNTTKEPAEIQWITNINELQAKMSKKPKKVYMDIYTDWCGWCKKMDVSTFTNLNVVRYMNTHYYCFKFNAERQDTLHFLGKDYYFKPEYKCNTLAAELMKGQMSYPTAILMTENFENAQPVPGYRTVSQLETLVTYMGDDAYKHDSWDNYSKTYKSTWDNGAVPDMTPPPGH